MISDESVSTLLLRAERRLRARRATEWAGRVGVVALAIVLLEGLIARIVASPDLKPAMTLLLILPVVVGIAGWVWRPDVRKVRAEAGNWVGEPALLLAMDAGIETELQPLVTSRACVRAASAAAPRRHFGRLFRTLPVLYLVAVLVVVAPGRIGGVSRLPDGSVQSVREAGRALKADGLPEAISSERQRTVDNALRQLDDPAVSREEVEAAIAQLRAALKEAGGTWDAFTDAASKTALLEPTWHAMDRGDAAAALRAIQDLAERIRDGKVDPSELRRASEALIAAASGAGSNEDRSLFDAAGNALVSGDGSGLERALTDLLDDLRPPGAAARRMKRTVVALEQALGRPGGEGAPSPAGDGAPLKPRDPTVEMARHAFADQRDLLPLQREILRNYFTRR